jgi:uncharacterized protein with FMN-binding domain
VKRIVLWVLSTLSTVVVLFGYHTSTSSVMATSTGTTFSGSLQGQSTSGGSGTTGGTTSSGSAPPSDSSGSSGSVTGDTAQTRWGPVQVQLEVSGSTITHVSILQYPDGNGRDVEIANYALPQLIQDTLDSQGHSVSMVSGATYTSQGYLQSLQSALDRAGL